jgi:hypothetical protein
MNAYILIVMTVANSIAIVGNNKPIETKWPVVTLQRFEDKQACENAIDRIRKSFPGPDSRMALDCVPASFASTATTRDK